MTAQTGTKTPEGTTFQVQFEYNGELFPDKVKPQHKIGPAWDKALRHFGIRPEDAASQNLGLFREGNEVDRNQTFDQAGIKEDATLRISPRVQRAG
jgi:hypothetical protein